MTIRYVSIVETRCGKCKHLKFKLMDRTAYYCEAHKEELPDHVVSFFGDACTDFEPKK